MAFVGGDPASMTGGARTLSRASRHIGSAKMGVAEATSRAASGSGHESLSASLNRWGAVLAAAAEDTGTQAGIAAGLADYAAADLERAMGPTP